MIVVNVNEEKITLDGHAGYAEPGKDIVCAAVTALTQTMVHSIKALTEDKPEYTACPGKFEMEIKNLSEKSKTLVDSFFYWSLRYSGGIYGACESGVKI